MSQSYERGSRRSSRRAADAAAAPRSRDSAVTAAIENYLKQIDELSARGSGRRVLVGEVAQAVGVTPGTVTAMLRRLAEAGLATYERYGGVTLTTRGRTEARRVLRRHRIIELFLVDVLGLDWSEVHDEAERLEHALSDKVLDRLDALLRRPTVDPHGDPIPANDGSMIDRRLMALADAVPGHRVRVARVMDQSAPFLRFIAESALRPSSILEVLSIDRAGETMTFRTVGRESRTISRAAAWKVMVDDAGPDPRPGRGASRAAGGGRRGRRRG